MEDLRGWVSLARVRAREEGWARRAGRGRCEPGPGARASREGEGGRRRGLAGYALADRSNLSTAPVSDYPPLRRLPWTYDAAEEAQPCPQRGRSFIEAQSRSTLPIRLEDSRHVLCDRTDEMRLGRAVSPEREERSSPKSHVADGASQRAEREAETLCASPTTKRPRVAGSDRDNRADPS